MENGEKGRAPSLDDVMRAVLPEDMPMHPDHPMQQAEPDPAQDERGEFVREDRYLVIKYADLNKVPAEYRLPFLEYLDDVNAELPHREFVVVESDWPEYEPVWKMIEDRVAGGTRPAQTEQRPIRLPQRADTSHGDAFDTQLAEAYNAALDEVARLNAAPIAQTAPQPEQSGLYTCIGKGGSYELIGRATTAGALKVTGRFADEVIVYRDTKSNALYCREPGDFRLRMARAALSTQGGSDE
jgi:hypothetical protein